MKSAKIILSSAVIIFAVTTLSQARSGSRGEGRGSGGSHNSGSHVSRGAPRGGHHGGGVFTWRPYYYPRAYWGPSPYYWVGGWTYYYPPAYYYPPLAYDYATLFPLPSWEGSVPHPQDSYQPPGPAGQVVIYPRKGQSLEQQTKDINECRDWALKQTGMDLNQPVPAGMSVPQLLQKSKDYIRALEACLDARGYGIR